jgi:F0F1-type ATP synthase beta subunit
MQRTNFNPTLITERFIVNYMDFREADGSTTIDLMTLAKGTVVRGVRLKQTTAFTDGAGCTATMAVGSAAVAVDTFATAYSVAAAPADTTLQMSSGWKAGTYAEDTLTATLACNVNTNTLTAGVAIIDVALELYPNLVGTGIPAGTGGGYV